MQNKTIVLTGGGTAGHVTPNIALLDDLKAKQWDVHYIGSPSGVEKAMIEQLNVPYHAVRSGKLRRYFSWQNFIDPVNVIIGILQSLRILSKLKPQVIFSKGGFVALPVVIAGYLLKIPVIIHESDMTPGLANKLSFPFARRICLNFANSKRYFAKKSKLEVTGTPIRAQLFAGSRQRGLELCGFTVEKPCLLVIGGSKGAVAINRVVRDSLKALTAKYQLIHICGRGNLDAALQNIPGYFQIEYADSEIADIFAASDIVLSRSGANSLCELLALRKPHVLIPLPLTASRGDQIHNANYFAQQGISEVLIEEKLTEGNLLNALQNCEDNQVVAVDEMNKLGLDSATGRVLNLIESFAAD